MKYTNLIDEYGEAVTIEEEKYFYCCDWESIHAEAKRQGVEDFNDVRVAGGLLDQIGFRNSRSFASEEMHDDTDYKWVIYWA